MGLMGYVPPARLLQGLTVRQARAFCAPSVGASYAGRSVRSNRLDEGARCAVCGRPATNAHHEPPVGMGGGRARLALNGVAMRPALIALCGSGTTGCHGKVHSGALRLEWAFDSDEEEELWWRGWFAPEVYEAGAAGLGRWEVRDRAGNLLKTIRRD